MTQLNARQQKVLWATIRHYVSTAEPVGSKALIEAYGLKVSAATVRNTMGILERSGLLYQPHTSAGRVPSDSGYRLYVDQLIQPSKPVAQQVDRALATRLDWQGRSLDGLLREASKILAALSGYVALVTMPTVDATRLRHVQLVQVADCQVLLVVVLDGNSTESVLIRLPGQVVGLTEPADLDRQLQILSNFLTAQLCGQTLAAIATLNWDELDAAFQCYAATLQTAMADLSQRLRQAQIAISGLAEVISQPEFSERDQVRNLLSLLEDGPTQLTPLFQVEPDPKVGAPSPLQIWIGSENPLAPMQTCALISSTYGRDDTPRGNVGVLGPTRMLYENAIAAVEATANYLTDAMVQAA
ncbi:MAG: heat-inducible transcriptional repressor HrcA [Cyanobacteria bacterium P01_A01_bin.105]